jgi:hypothetical protein
LISIEPHVVDHQNDRGHDEGLQDHVRADAPSIDAGGLRERISHADWEDGLRSPTPVLKYLVGHNQ